MTSSAPNWSDSNLRRRSFRGKNLEGANFQGADLRGCDFSQAQLQGANFAHAQLGLCPQSLAIGIILLIGSGAIAFHMLSQLIFSILDITAEDPNYVLRLILIMCLALVGGLTGIAQHIKYTHLRMIIAAGVEGLLLGFFWGGVLTNLSFIAAVICGSIGVLIFLIGANCFYRQGFGIIVNTMGTTFANGMFFIAGFNALQALFVGRLLFALSWGLLTLLYLGWTLQSIGHLYRDFKKMAWTSFEEADLRQTRWQ